MLGRNRQWKLRYGGNPYRAARCRAGRRGCYTREKPPSSEELATAYKPDIETCIAAFGVDRGMFESHFSPDGASSSYPILRNALKRLAAGYFPSEKAALFSGTAKRVYRLA
jgi:L-fuconolactonase